MIVVNKSMVLIKIAAEYIKKRKKSNSNSNGNMIYNTINIK